MNTALICGSIIAVCLTIIALMAILYLKDRAFAKERADYINRIVAKSNNEYMQLRKPDDKPKQKTDREIIDEDLAYFEGRIN